MTQFQSSYPNWMHGTFDKLDAEVVSENITGWLKYAVKANRIFIGKKVTPKPETRNLKPETRDPKPLLLNPKPERSPRPCWGSCARSSTRPRSTSRS
jgi:hypothetical protein